MHKVLDLLTTRGYSLLHMCVFVCAGLCQRGIVFLETGRVNQLHLKPLSGQRGELTISHLSLAHCVQPCNVKAILASSKKRIKESFTLTKCI